MQEQEEEQEQFHLFSANAANRNIRADARKILLMSCWKYAFITTFILCTSISTITTLDDFELDTSENLVECLQCVQLWRSATTSKDKKECVHGAKTCRGTACYMRQCKHCPVYQYMSGCVNLTPWQLADIESNRRSTELRMRRVGAILLCEDTFNQTTCVCNRRDKCNSIHSRIPFSTYAEGLFRGVVNFDSVIGALDPRYTEVMTGYKYHFFDMHSSSNRVNFLPFLSAFSISFCIFYCLRV
ncbi:unnamed protein product [Caenorhabditis angaria]|uniref:Uncharacterized protein n=1 Tax=Caenorhabditis angaria TaxID=860376 RepID=A0A9P1IGC6_9PELO|nr:unnamed protein product [Caenorhabditis angaria]